MPKSKGYDGMPEKLLMTPVCKENDGMEWLYDNDNQKFVRFNGKDFSMWISGKYLPNPFLLWKNRVDVGVNKEKARPQDVTFKLFEYWQKVSV